MVSSLACQSNDRFWADRSSEAVDLDGDDFPDNQSSSSGSLSDDGSSQDSASSVSSAPSAYSASLDDSGILSRAVSNESTYGTSSQCPFGSSDSARNWMETVNNPSLNKIVPLEQRQNPRRTCSSSNTIEAKQPPCSLIRQEQRKNCFVAILVGFATQFVEAIWPLAACTPRTDTCFFGRGVLPLRTFITETLRRSRTSYSTLQVALYYLVLIKDHLPKANFCTEQPRADEEFRSMQCGRRMFLTALILASKYLQDRNYSTRAWSKISGLRAKEIHLNEMHYCKTVHWQLHIPPEKFQRWSRIVLRLSAPTGNAGSDTVAQQITWPRVLSKLNSDLTETFESPLVDKRSTDLFGFAPTANFTFGDSNLEKQRLETPKGMANVPEIPHSEGKSEHVPQLPPPYPGAMSQPPMPRIHNLPTPQTTPQLQAFRNFCQSQTPSMSMAMSQARYHCLMRATLDRCPPPAPSTTYISDSSSPERGRRPSLSQSTSSLTSSPESMISDVASITSRASRSSSISSVASTAASCVNRRLDRYACRNAAALNDVRGLPADAFKAQDLVRSEWAALPAVQDLRVDVHPDSVSPMAYERPLSSTSSRSGVGYESYRPTKPDLGLQDLEAAAALCKLRPTFPDINSSLLRSSENTPIASRLNSSATDASREQSPSRLTPRPNKSHGFSGQSVLPQKCHKRSYSKASDPLQDNVRAQLRSSLCTELPDRSAKGDTPTRWLPAQSPTLTFGVSKTPIVVKNGNGSKRTCSDEDYPVSAADRAAQYLRSHLPPISQLPLVNTPS